MRIRSGDTTKYIYFVAVDATDFTTRETGLTTFTVYRSRDGAAAAAMTTPTINETDTTNMPGVYELLLDEDMSLAAGHETEEISFHITHAGMSPVTRTVEIYRSDTGAIADAIWAKSARTLTGFAFDTGVQQAIARLDTGLSETIDRIEDHDTGLRVLINRFDTGVTSAVDATNATLAAGVNVDQLDGDTGAADVLGKFATLLSATGTIQANTIASDAISAAKIATDAITAAKIAANAIGASELATDAVNEIAQATAALDTGVRQLITRFDTGVNDGLADNLAAINALDVTDTGVYQLINRFDTGVTSAVDAVNATLATGVNVDQIDGDTGAADDLGKFADLLNATGQLQAGAIATDAITAAKIATDAIGSAELATSAVNEIAQATAALDTGVRQLINRFDTGVQETIDRIEDHDTGLRVLINRFDTGVTSAVDAVNATLATGVNVDQIDGDTGAADRLGKFAGVKVTDSGTFDTGTGSLGATVTGGVNVIQLGGDTGALAHLRQFADEYDTGRIAAEATATLDTGAVNDAVWQTLPGVSIRTLTNLDTGNLIHLAQMADEYDTGRLPAEASATLDTGAVNQAVWQGNSTRTLTAWAFDTGVQQAIARLDTGLSETIDRIEDFDTGMRQLVNRFDTGVTSAVDAVNATLATGVNVDQIDGDTGAALGLKEFSNLLNASGQIQAGVLATDAITAAKVATDAVNEIAQATAALDTGVRQLITRFDTGVNDGLADNLAAINALDVTDTGIYQLVNRLDTGVQETIDRIEDHDTGLRVLINRFDTGVTDAVDAVNATLATGVNVDQIDGDTGAADRFGKFAGIKLTDSGTLDTGTGISSGGAASVDTGQINQAVWQGNSSRTLTAWAFDTGVQQAIARLDTGLSETIDRIEDHDTGLRVLINRFDTGVNDGLADNLAAINAIDDSDTGLYALINAIDDTDTGVRQLINRFDTGVMVILDKLTFDTGGNELHADIRKVNNVQIQGAGDTGLNNTWRPV